MKFFLPFSANPHRGLRLSIEFFYLFQLKYNRPFPVCQNYRFFSQKYRFWIPAVPPLHCPCLPRFRPAGAMQSGIEKPRKLQLRSFSLCSMSTHPVKITHFSAKNTGFERWPGRPTAPWVPDAPGLPELQLRHRYLQKGCRQGYVHITPIYSTNMPSHSSLLT